MKQLIFGSIVLLAVLHQDFWWWDTADPMLFGFIPIQQNNRVQRAVDYLPRQHGGDELVNITIRDRWFWAYVLNGYKTSVRGTVVKKK